MTGYLVGIEAVLIAAALGLAMLRWLRVAQAEHYIAGSATRFARRWWTSTALNIALLVGALVGIALAVSGVAGASIAVALAGCAGPIGLGIQGRTSRLAWTRRLRTLAAVSAAVSMAVWAILWPLSAGSIVPLLVPLLVDLACWITRPFEDRAARRWVDRAAERVAQVKPRIVAITGSYGKTSTKNYLAHLLAESHTVVASPRSFNNRAGLARAVNEHLVPGTDVFVAEMGTYGRGEIAELCQWLPPEVAVITAIGPVHLERFGSEDAIVIAKSEITEQARVVVLNADDARLAQLAERLAAQGKEVMTCSTVHRSAGVAVVPADDGWEIFVRGERAGRLDSLEAPPGNVACAVAAALAVGAPVEGVVKRLADLPAVANRLAPVKGQRGALILDDTFNSNPAGAARALEVLARSGSNGGRRVVVTPGMVELGPRQREENRLFAKRAAEVASHVVVVGQTNRKALVEGAREGGAEVVLAASRPEAVRWVSQHVGPGDAVLYENDLPDLYP